MPRAIDITGQRFGRYVAIRRLGRKPNSGSASWECACDCGETREVPVGNLRSGASRSCGCLKADLARGAKSSNETTWASWNHAKMRCTNPNNDRFKDYGGRGIKICERWLNSFDAFLSDMGARPEGRTLDRICNDGDYEPGNCKWSTPKEQAQNRRRQARWDACLI